MSHQFKPGDLALTLASIPGHITAGACVEVRRILEAGEEYQMPDARFRTNCKMVMVTKGRSHYLYKPSELMPLRGDFSPEQQKAKEAEPCA
ncbi:hypothetical protein [Pseudomonas sp. NY15374]|uniref:hypothetical protein n=1 Tax=Pseudomonas sp. NY15374 TaxID=3400357 RepID=UPI003A899A75